MPLEIIVVGAGIAGLVAAVSLEQAGHHVKVFEKSAFATEIGAALGLTPNGTRLLRNLGFSFERARARPMPIWDIVNGGDLSMITSLDFSDAEKRFGGPTYAVHRVDFHTELLRLHDRKKSDEDHDGSIVPPSSLHLSSTVVDCNTKDGIVTLSDGTTHRADLIVGADGIHSVIRAAVLEDEDSSKPVPTGLSAFRFLIATDKLKADKDLAQLLKWKSLGATTIVDSQEKPNGERIQERHMIWYDCQDGEVQNFVGFHPTRPEELLDDLKQDYKASMLAEFSHFHPDIVRVIELSSHVKCWPIALHDPLSHWVNERAVIIGDAAHPMLPFGGQGANQAIEDAAALGYLLKGVESVDRLPARLALFEQVRIKRASLIQTLSKARVGKEMTVQEEIKPFAEPPGSKVPTNFMERTQHHFVYDVVAECQQLLAAQA